MYIAIDNEDGTVYAGNNVAELRMNLEAGLEIPTDMLPANYERWSDSRRVTYYIQAGFITPHAGPEWFMDLKIPEVNEEGDIADDIRYGQKRINIIRYDGSLSQDAEVQVTFWRERNHIRLVFMDKDQIYGELFITEESLRTLWVLLGSFCHFEEAGLNHALLALPPARVYTQETTPERFPRLIREHGFDILKALEEMDFGTDSDSETTSPDEEDID